MRQNNDTVFGSENTEQKKLCIWTISKSSYSIQMQENTDPKKLRIWTLFMQCSSSG